MHHSHFDLGYTDPQALVLRHHLAYLDSALDLAAADDGFRWTIESNLPLERWLAARPRAARDELLALVRSGRFEVCALPFTMHAEALSIDELARQLRFAEELRAPPRPGDRRPRCRPTCPAGRPACRSCSRTRGVRYLAVAHNWAGRATPHLTGGESLPRAFHWGTASGKRVLVWHTDSPHGVAYLEGNLLGLADSYADAHDLLPEYLAALASRGYPYAGPHETLGLPAGAREPYPFDLLHLRVQGLLADNAGPSPVPAQIAAAWAREYAYPQLVPSTNRDFFERLEERHGAELETYRGDWADWWADGLGSAAREVGFNRRAQAAVRTAQTLHVMADALTGAEPELDWAGEADRVYERMALFDEHTWCAAHPAGRALTGRESSELQWQSKAALAVEARDRAEALHEAARARFRAGAPRLDPRAQPERPRAHRPGRALRAGGACRRDRPLAVVDVERGERVPHAFGAPEPSRNRPQGRLLSFVARDVPALGYRRFELVADGAARARGRGRAPLENEHYRVELDAEGGYALRARRPRARARPRRRGERVRLRAGRPRPVRRAASRDGARASRRRAHLRAAGRRALRRADPRAHDARRRDRPRTRVERRSRSGSRCGLGPRASRRSRRPSGSCAACGGSTSPCGSRSRRPTEKESVHVVFPFAARDPSVAYELTGGVGGGASVPGGAAHVHAIRHWVALQDAAATVAWGTLEAPLVQLGNVFLPYPPYPATIDGAGRRAGHLVGDEQRLGHELPADAGRRGALRLRSLLVPARRRRALARDRDRGRAHPTARRRPRGNRRRPGRNGVRAGRPGRRGRDARCGGDGGGVELHLQSYAEDEVAVRVGGRDVRIAPGDYVTVPVELGRRGA